MMYPTVVSVVAADPISCWLRCTRVWRIFQASNALLRRHSTCWISVISSPVLLFDIIVPLAQFTAGFTLSKPNGSRFGFAAYQAADFGVIAHKICLADLRAHCFIGAQRRAILEVCKSFSTVGNVVMEKAIKRRMDIERGRAFRALGKHPSSPA